MKDALQARIDYDIANDNTYEVHSAFYTYNGTYSENDKYRAWYNAKVLSVAAEGKWVNRDSYNFWSDWYSGYVSGWGG